jgi:hypothetical protein
MAPIKKRGSIFQQLAAIISDLFICRKDGSGLAQKLESIFRKIVNYMVAKKMHVNYFSLRVGSVALFSGRHHCQGQRG